MMMVEIGVIAVLLVSIGVAAVLIAPLARKRGLSKTVSVFLVLLLLVECICFSAAGMGENVMADEDNFAHRMVKKFGFVYHPEENTFSSRLDAWQRKMGYWRLYDEGSAPFGMIIDCEPIYFQYDNRIWLIQFWKGQYDLSTGCEIGVYNAKKYIINPSAYYKNTFYRCAADEDMLYMEFSIYKDGEIIMQRQGRHWWLTGFIVGGYAEPEELVMPLSITLKDEEMRDAFLGGLKNAGYHEEEIVVSQNTVSLVFDKVRTTQPFTRSRETDALIQKKNKLLCDWFEFFKLDILLEYALTH